MNMQYFHLLLLNVCSLNWAWTSCHFFPLIHHCCRDSLRSGPKACCCHFKETLQTHFIQFSCLFFLSQNSPSRDQSNNFRLWKRTDVAKLTFDLYKNNPEDFIGCLNVKATFYGVYSVSYDLRCYAAKKMLKWVQNPWRFMFFFVRDHHRIWWIHWGIELLTVLSSCSHTVPP